MDDSVGAILQPEGGDATAMPPLYSLAAQPQAIAAPELLGSGAAAVLPTAHPSILDIQSNAAGPQRYSHCRHHPSL